MTVNMAEFRSFPKPENKIKTCKHENCKNKPFSGGFCFFHQNSRRDDKYLNKQREKRQRKIIKIKGTPVKVERKATGEKDIFFEIGNEREHVSQISGIYLYELTHFNFHHVIEKSKLEAGRLDKENIIICTPYEHNLIHFGTEKQRLEYAERLKKQGYAVNWGILQEIKEKIIKKYK
jgi:hypothetical protein